MLLSLDKHYLKKFISDCEYTVYNDLLYKNVKNNIKDMFPHNTGWVDFCDNITEENIQDIITTAKQLRKISEYVVIIGIGGSYLGAKAIYEALTGYFVKNTETKLLFAGQNLSGQYINDLIEFLQDKDWSINVISKSGTTLETAISFYTLFKQLKLKYKNNVKDRVVITTDRLKGDLNQLNKIYEFKKFIIPDNIGGRFSVITPVGLLPLAIAGINIRKLISTTRGCVKKYNNINSIAYQYAVIRYILYKKEFFVELLGFYEPKLFYMGEWWKQLFGESEGKNSEGIFPVTAQFTTDLHSLGQYIQQGKNILFETIIKIKQNKIDYKITNIPIFNYLENKTYNYVNDVASQATCKAHYKGDTPNIIINIEKLDEESIAELIYFFEIACTASCILLNNNPFDQPGVEEYKKNMHTMLQN